MSNKFLDSFIEGAQGLIPVPKDTIIRAPEEDITDQSLNQFAERPRVDVAGIQRDRACPAVLQSAVVQQVIEAGVWKESEIKRRSLKALRNSPK